jgi:chromosome segregation ATPase
LDQIDQELAALGYDLEAHENCARLKTRAGRPKRTCAKLEGARSALAPIEREIAGLEKQQEELEKNLAAMTATYDEAMVQFAAAEGDLPDLAQAESDLHDIQEQENRLHFGMSVRRCKL